MSETKEINIPIICFPPFKLRSSLIDKDPVIWQFLLEDYINLFQKLIIITKQKDFRLSIKSQQQLTIFMKVYLYETSEETTRIFSLGAINSEILKNQKLLKLIIFQFIKGYNLINLKLTGEGVWNFCNVYLKLAFDNASTNQSLINVGTVRHLVEGTIKSKLNSKSDDICLIRNLQDHLLKIVSEKKFNRMDVETLYMLLGQKTKKNVKQKGSNNYNDKKNFRIVSNNNNNGSNQGGNDFSEIFVSKHWLDSLEDLYNKGESIHSKTCFQLMVISMSSLSTPKIAKILQKHLEINSKVQLVKIYPLTAKVVLSKKFNDLNPDLPDQLVFLTKKRDKQKKQKSAHFDNDKIASVKDMFPQIVDGKIKTLLLDYDNNVEGIINKLLENPNDLDRIQDYDEIQKKKRERSKVKRPSNVVDFKLNGDTQVTVQFGKKEVQLGEADEVLKKKTLQSALKLLYEADEDEPDDTYDDQELTKGASEDNINIKQDSKLAKIEEKIFQIYKTTPELLSRTARHTNYRKQLKEELKWTDEQIEGWARMLEKNPRRFRLLEDNFIHINSSLNSNTKLSTKWSNVRKEEQDDIKKPEVQYKPKNPDNFHQYMDKKKQQSNNNKNKAKKANHNRKRAHDKKTMKMNP